MIRGAAVLFALALCWASCQALQQLHPEGFRCLVLHLGCDP